MLFFVRADGWHNIIPSDDNNAGDRRARIKEILKYIYDACENASAAVGDVINSRAIRRAPSCDNVNRYYTRASFVHRFDVYTR